MTKRSDLSQHRERYFVKVTNFVVCFLIGSVISVSMSVSLQKHTKRTNLKHNNRVMSEKEKELNPHIDESRSDENKYLIQKDIRELYEEEFGDALEKYNAKQRRKDRKIKDYYKHIKSGKKTATQQELIIQVGDQDDFINEKNHKLANEILEEWFESFQKRNPNLKVYNAVIHNDEASPHLHLNFVPVASGYKRGLGKQVAFDRAIKQQDKKIDVERPFDVWRDNEVQVLEQLLKERGIERKLVGTNEYEDVNELKKVTAERKKLERERELLEKEKKAYFENLNKNIDPAADEKLTYSYKEKVMEEYETVEKNFFGKEKVVVKERKIQTENYVMTPKQIQKVNKVFNDYRHLKSEYERLNGVLSDEMELRVEQEMKHEEQLKTINKDINERAERLKDKKFGELQKENMKLKQNLEHEEKHYKVLAEEYSKVSEENKEVKDVLKQAVEDNERLYKENSKLRETLRETIEYFEWRIECLWSVTKDYLKEYTWDAKGAIEDIKDLFEFKTGEEIESKPQKKKNKGWEMDR